MAVDRPLKAVIVPVTPFAQNCSVVWCTATAEGAVIDPGGDLDRIRTVVVKQQIRIVKILVTPGHVVFFHDLARVAFVGDVLFRGSIGRTDFPRGNHQNLIDSIRFKLWPLGDDVTFVPGQSPVSTFGKERRSNPFVSDAALAAM